METAASGVFFVVYDTVIGVVVAGAVVLVIDINIAADTSFVFFLIDAITVTGGFYHRFYCYSR